VEADGFSSAAEEVRAVARAQCRKPRRASQTLKNDPPVIVEYSLLREKQASEHRAVGDDPRLQVWNRVNTVL